MAIPRVRNYRGPGIFSYGFRPFFFFGAVQASLVMLVWLPLFYGTVEISSLFGAVQWHSHEIFFGYLAAIITGYLFTSVPNWSGRMPLQGAPLLLLLLVWMAGRVAVSFSAYLGWELTLVIDLAFLTLVVFVIGNEIISGRNWRNLKILLPATVFWLANLGFHLEAHVDGMAFYSERLALSVAITLIMLIGGRIVPSFTRNYLARQSPGRLPTPFGRFDIAATSLAVIALGAWILLPAGIVVAALMGIAGILHLIRLARWAGERVAGDFVVAILHVSYLFIPAGFLLLALSNTWPADISPVAGIHALGVGAIGSMTLSVMIRSTVSLTGGVLKTNMKIRLILMLVWIAALARIAAALYAPAMDILLEIAAAAWVLAFAGFSAAFAPMLFRRRGAGASRPGA